MSLYNDRPPHPQAAKPQGNAACQPTPNQKPPQQAKPASKPLPRPQLQQHPPRKEHDPPPKPPPPPPQPPPQRPPEANFLNRLLASLHLGDLDAGDLLLLGLLFFLWHQKADEELLIALGLLLIL